MMVAGEQDRNRQAAEYLQLLLALGSQLEKAMQAIADNSLAELEESITNQEMLSSRIQLLVKQLSAPLQAGPAPARRRVDDALAQEITMATDSLQHLNRNYAALLEHSGRSVAMMASLFASFRGQIQEASGPRLKYQTWSCRM